MKKSEEVEKAEEGFELRLHPRATTTLSLRVPVDALASLERVAASREMSVEALARLYIGQGLRQDLARLFADQVLARTEQVLTRHLRSEEVTAILQEIRSEAA